MILEEKNNINKLKETNKSNEIISIQINKKKEVDNNNINNLIYDIETDIKQDNEIKIIIDENNNKTQEKNLLDENNNINEESEENKYNEYDNEIQNYPISHKYGCVGLYNLGNTCYMNSSLQVLKNIYPLTKYILLENKIEEGRIIKEYTNLLYNLISKNNSSTDASEFKKALSKYDNYFSGYQQKDCIKCITSVLSALNIDLKRKDVKNYEFINKNDEEENKFNQSYNKIIKRKNSIIFDLFFGFLKLLYKCKSCDYKKVVFQCFNYLDLSVFDIDKDKKIKNLEDCIKYYERETISEFKCEKCEGEIMMKNTIYKLPQILIICFNRVYNNEHLNHLVEYPEYFNSNDYFSEKPKLLYPSNSKEENLYSLNGLIIHFGSANSGHKTSFCKNFFNNNWYYFNDSSISFINYITKSVLNRKDTFLLVYQNSSININSNDKKLIKNKCDKHCKGKYINNSISNNYIYNTFNFSISNCKNDNSFEKTDSNNSDDNLIQFNSESNMEYKIHYNQNEKKSNKKIFLLVFFILLVLIIVVIINFVM